MPIESRPTGHALVHGHRIATGEHAMVTRQLRMTVHDPEAMTGEELDADLQPLSGPMGKVSFVHHQVRHDDSRYTEDLTPALSDIRVPVHILWGADDRRQPAGHAHRLERDIPGARLQIIPETGHFSPEDAPDTLADAVRDFAHQHE